VGYGVPATLSLSLREQLQSLEGYALIVGVDADLGSIHEEMGSQGRGQNTVSFFTTGKGNHRGPHGLATFS
jgi:hypothetical protein